MKVKIKYKSKLSHIKDIEERNKAFDNLSDEDKRREIAWDSLQLILKGLIQPSNGFYWSTNLSEIAGDHPHDSKGLQKELLNVPKCQVCARGAVMLSQIRLGNSITGYQDSIDRGDRHIVKGFSMESMYNMEREFEDSMYMHPYRWGSLYKLANILCNVITNGDFNIEDREDYIKKPLLSGISIKELLK